MKNQNLNVEELRETRSVDEANELLHTGWRLLEIVDHRRGHIYILGARNAVDLTHAVAGLIAHTVDAGPGNEVEPASNPNVMAEVVEAIKAAFEKARARGTSPNIKAEEHP